MSAGFAAGGLLRTHAVPTLKSGACLPIPFAHSLSPRFPPQGVELLQGQEPRLWDMVHSWDWGSSRGRLSTACLHRDRPPKRTRSASPPCTAPSSSPHAPHLEAEPEVPSLFKRHARGCASSFAMGGGDIICQKALMKEGEGIDYERAARFGLVGLTLHGPYFHHIFRQIDRTMGPSSSLTAARAPHPQHLN